MQGTSSASMKASCAGVQRSPRCCPHLCLQVAVETVGAREYMAGIRIYCGDPLTCINGQGGVPPAPPPAAVQQGAFTEWIGAKAGPAAYDASCPCGTFVNVSCRRARRLLARLLLRLLLHIPFLADAARPAAPSLPLPSACGKFAPRSKPADPPASPRCCPPLPPSHPCRT